MKKLVLVVAMFMFVCGGSFLVKAQSSAEAVTAPTEINATVVNDTVVKDTGIGIEKEKIRYFFSALSFENFRTIINIKVI